MTREAITRLLIPVGLALLLTISLVLPLHAASPARFASHQRAKGLAQTTITETTPTAPSMVVSPTVAPTPTLAPTPTRSPINRAISFLSANRILAVSICLILLFMLVLLLIILRLRRKKPAPAPSPPPAPVTPPTLTAPPHLESIRTAGGPRRFELVPEGIMVGRDQENDLTITQDFARWETVSKYHARIFQLTDHWIVEDLDSMNGVYVNGKRTGRNLLQDGWQLDIGGVGFVFRVRTKETEQ